MKRLALSFLLVFSSNIVFSCSKDLPETTLQSNNEAKILSNSSGKKFNLTQRKKAILAKTNNNEKLAVKDLPPNFIFVPLSRQASDYTCGVGVTQSMMMYYGDEYMEGELAKELKADPNEGTAYSNISKFVKENGYSVNITKNMTLDELKKSIDNKKPVIVLLQAWSEKPTDYSKDWEDGHYSIAIGYDQKRIYFMDPSTLGNYTFIPTQQFLDRWHDTDTNEKLYNFGMVIEKKSPKKIYNRNDILKMD